MPKKQLKNIALYSNFLSLYEFLKQRTDQKAKQF